MTKWKKIFRLCFASLWQAFLGEDERDKPVCKEIVLEFEQELISLLDTMAGKKKFFSCIEAVNVCWI